MAVCNLFSELKSSSGNFLMFSQYVEDITHNYTEGDNWKVVPTKFVALNIDYSKISDEILKRDEDLNTLIPKYFQNCFENACAYGRENYSKWVEKTTGSKTKTWNPEISRNLFWNCMFDGELLHPVEYGNTKIVNEVVYFDNIHMHSFNDHKGMGYGEIYCYIPTDAAKKRSQVICIADSDPSGRKSEKRTGVTFLEGHKDKYVEGFEQEYFYNRDFSMSFDDDTVGNIMNDTVSKYEFNTIVVLYDVFKRLNNEWISAYSCIPLGIYFTGRFEGKSMSNTVTKYVTTSYGTGTSYGVRICTRFSVSHANGIITDIVSDDSNYTNTAQLMTAMNANLSKMLDIVKSTQDTSNQYKDLLSIFKNNKTNVPYIKDINGTDYWFVNGKFVSAVNTPETMSGCSYVSDDTIQTRIDKLKKLKLDDDPTNDYSDFNYIEDPNGMDCLENSISEIVGYINENIDPDFKFNVPENSGDNTGGSCICNFDTDYASDEEVAGLLNREWSYPVKLVNNSKRKSWFSSLDNPEHPDENPENWSEYESEDSKWLATSALVNDEWTEWDIKRIKEEHQQGEEFYESVVFTRSLEDPPIPSGGSFERPFPSNIIWTDGIPEGNEPLWMSFKIFYSYIG